MTGMQVEREGEAARDRRGRQAGKGRARKALDAALANAEVVDAPPPQKGTVVVVLELRGGRSLTKLVDKLSEIDGVTAVRAGEAATLSD